MQYKYTKIYTRKNRPYPFNLNRCITKLKDHYWFAESFVVKPLFLLHVFCNDMAALTDRVHFYGDIFILKKCKTRITNNIVIIQPLR